MTHPPGGTNSGVVIFEGVPPGTEVGIDYKSWHVGPKFRGIKNVPPGFHYVFFSAVDKHDQHAPRTGFFVHMEEGEVVVRKYDQKLEDLMDDNVTDEDIQRYRDTMSTLQESLGPYPQDVYNKWQSLTDCISKVTLQRVEPKCKQIGVLTEVALSSGGRLKHKTKELDSRLEHIQDPELLINFTTIPSTYPEGCSPQQISLYNMDSSYFLSQYLKSTQGEEEKESLGELQFAFVSFLLGQVYDAFDHWKALVSLFTSCQEALREHPKLFIKFLDILQIQILEIPEDFFVDIVVQKNFLVLTFRDFFRNFDDPDGIDGELLRKASMFKHEMITRFEWDFDGDESDEDAPVVVELP